MAQIESDECPPELKKRLAWSRWVVALTIAIAMAIGWVFTHLMLSGFITDVREIKQRVRSIEQKVDENTAALIEARPILESIEDNETVRP